MVNLIIAFLATVMTAVQSLLIYTKGQALCLNSGCGIVESLTTVPPLYFNLAGFFFFLTIFCCFYFAKNGSRYWLKFARLLLLAGLVAEAVLVFFQHTIAQVFCSYCLVVLSFIVLLNLLSGARQIFRGVILAISVLAACYSLQFTAGAGSQSPLSGGVIAVTPAVEGGAELNLFFSDSCPHCEKVIDYLKEKNSCVVSFNPVKRVADFDFQGGRRNASYDPQVNLGFMNSLSLKEIPVMVARDADQIRVINGGIRILEYLKANCRSKEQGEEVDYSGSSSMMAQGGSGFTNPSKPLDDNCQVAEDCAEQDNASASSQ